MIDRFNRFSVQTFDLALDSCAEQRVYENSGRLLE
jgi:hypothetical protein